MEQNPKQDKHRAPRCAVLGLSVIPDSVSDEQAIFVGDILATGYWAAKISEIDEDDTVLIIGAGPTGVCTLLCTMLKKPERIIVCEKDSYRADFIRKHYPDVLVTAPEECREFVLSHSSHGGADRVIEAAGSDETFRMAWECARPNAIVTIVAMYDAPPRFSPCLKCTAKTSPSRPAGSTAATATPYCIS